MDMIAKSAVLLLAIGLLEMSCSSPERAISPAQPNQASSLSQIESTQTRDVTSVDPKEAPPSQQFITCTGLMTAYEAESHWEEYIASGRAWGEAPLATFRIQSPSIYAHRDVGILFRTKTVNSRGEIVPNPPPPDSSGIGNLFTFELPLDFLNGTFTRIGNGSVKELRKIANSPENGE